MCLQMTNTILTVNELCQRYHLKPRTVYRWVNSGKIPHLRAGRSLRFSVAEVDAWLKSHRTVNTDQRNGD